jgi:hypothetical protein
MKTCENCEKPAAVYAMGKYAGDWGGSYCLAHVPTGFIITDTYNPEPAKPVDKAQGNTAWVIGDDYSGLYWVVCHECAAESDLPVRYDDPFGELGEQHNKCENCEKEISK